MPIKIAITDDHLLVTEALRNALINTGDIEITGSFLSASELLEGLLKTVPDVLLLDLQLPDLSGAELVDKILKIYPAIKILILTGTESPILVQEIMRIGCRGYLLKSTTDTKTLVTAIHEVVKGRLYLAQGIKDRLLEDELKSRRTSYAGKNKLTAREKEVLQWIAQGLNNQDIASKLFVSIRTIENHRHNLLQKLDEKNAVGLLKAALKLGLIEP